MRASASSYAPRWRGKAAEGGARPGDVNDLAKLGSGALAALPFDEVAERSLIVKAPSRGRRMLKHSAAVEQRVDRSMKRLAKRRDAVEKRHTPVSHHVHRFWPYTDGNGQVIDQCCCGEVQL